MFWWSRVRAGPLAGGNESGAGADDRLAKGSEVVAGSVGGQRERFAAKVLRRIEIEVEEEAVRRQLQHVAGHQRYAHRSRVA